MHLPTSVLRPIVGSFNQIADDNNWNRFTALPWEQLKPELLTEGQKGAVIFVSYVEDHLPGYFQEYQRLFPIEETATTQEAVHNRELFRFIVRWGYEEDKHAQVLSLYQNKSGIEPSEEILEEKMILENRKSFSIGFSEPIQVFTYTLLQEKATQMYYQALARKVAEPVLAKLLNYLTKDEARHYAFFCQVVEAFLQNSEEDVLPMIEEVMFSYKMPLHNTMTDYRRKAILMAREAPEYDRMAPQSILATMLEKVAQKNERLNRPILKLTDRVRTKLNIR
ncbi:MAG: acyl-ACP desaturase [Leptospirales bacterium]